MPSILRLIRILIATGIAGALASGAMWLQQEFTATRDAALYRAIFYDAGGLQAGADVVERRAIVGEVSKVELFNGDALVLFSVDGDAHLGATTTASIRPETPTAQPAMELQSRGIGILQPGETIPLERTTSFSPSSGCGVHTPLPGPTGPRAAGGGLCARMPCFRWGSEWSSLLTVSERRSAIREIQRSSRSSLTT